MPAVRRAGFYAGARPHAPQETHLYPTEAQIEDPVSEPLTARLEPGLQARRGARHIARIVRQLAQAGFGIEHVEHVLGIVLPIRRSEERRVGKECVSTCRS